MGNVSVTSRVQWRNGLMQFSNEIDRAGEEAIEEASREGARISAALAPKRTGQLAGGIHTIGGGASGGWATGDTPWALVQEKGAGPHIIGEPGQTLSGEDFGPVLGPVLHPGNPGIHYMRRAYEIVAPSIIDRIRARL